MDFELDHELGRIQKLARELAADFAKRAPQHDQESTAPDENYAKLKAEELGYDTIWLTEHHFVEDGYSPAMMPLGAAIATRTKKIRIGTFVLLMPLHHPLHVAEQAATLDVLSNGRFDLGLGQGYRPQEFEGFNISRAERASRLREGVEIIRRVLS
jgi:alkanesulfonate monooxygenase SsuD/methylene tetrahydromethanopterin reductase-like flavin-dependent oxidoreductase (luciferase family)